MRKEAGFTLIELLVVVAIIGILAAVAIPVFTSYRARSYDSKSKIDLHHAAMGEESYFTTNSRYTDCIGTASCESTLPGFTGSPGVSTSMYDIPAAGGRPEYFTGQSFHPQGNRNSIGLSFIWNSNNGGLQ